MRIKSQAVARGSLKVAGVGDAVLRGASEHKVKGGSERKGSETYDRRSLSFRKQNNADPGPKI